MRIDGQGAGSLVLLLRRRSLHGLRRPLAPRSWLLAAAWLLCQSCPAQPAPSLSLSAALDAARAYDPRFRAAVQEYEASKEYRVQGQAVLGPSVTLGGSVGQNWLSQEVGNLSRKSDYTNSNLTVQLRHPLYNAELQARSREAEARSRQGEAAFAEKKSDLMLRLLEAYTDVPFAGELLATASAEVLALEEQLRAAAQARQAGDGTVTDEIEARSRLAIARARVVETRDAREDARARLALVLGPAPGEPRRLLARQDMPGRLPLDPPTLGEWETLALERNPSIQSRAQQLEAARQALERVDAMRRPRLDAIVGVYRADSDSINTVNQSSLQRSVGVQLNLPLYDNGLNASQTRQAIGAVGVAEAALQEARDNTLAELRQQYRALDSAVHKIAAYTEALRSATAQIQATRESVKGGIRVTLDVLNAETQQVSVQQELTKARFGYFKSWFRLHAAAGTLDAADLAVIDRHLQ